MSAGPARWIASGVGVAVAATVFAIVPSSGLPSWLVNLVGGGVTPLEHHGGAVIRYEVLDRDRAEAVARAMRQRGASSARAEHDMVIVELPQVSAEGAESAARSFGTNGVLEYRIVVENSDLMKRVYRAGAGRQGITAEVDQWRHDESGKQFWDYYLRGPSRAAIESFLGELAGDPEMRPDRNHMIGFEKVGPSPYSERQGFVRTYYLRAKAELGREDLKTARVVQNPIMGRPEVLLVFTAAGARKFADLTTRNVGRKLAVMLDGEVAFAPIIQSAITGGRSTITMGRGGPQAVHDAAAALAAALRAGPLPSSVRVVEVETVEATISPGLLFGLRVVLALLFGLLAFVAVFVAERFVPATPRLAKVRERLDARFWLAIAITAGAMVAVRYSNRMVLPGAPDQATLAGIRLFSLGLTPVFTAFILVELVALAVPSLRPLRTSGPRGRAVLGVCTAAVAISLAMLQAFFVVSWLGDVAARSRFVDMGAGSVPPLVTMLSLASAVFVLVVLAAVVDRFGVGNGYSVILLTGALLQAEPAYEYLQTTTATEVGWTLALLIFAIGGTAWLMRWRVQDNGDTSRVRMPTAGIIPLQWAVAALSLLGTAAMMGLAVELSWIDRLSFARWGRWLPYLGSVALLSVVLSLLFSRPRALRESSAEVVGLRTSSWRLFWIATAISTAYMLALVVIHILWIQRVELAFLSVPAVVVGTAVSMDLFAELRARTAIADLVGVWPLHRVQATDIALSALASAGISAFPRGLHHRSLLHFFGPFVPITIMVPRARAAEAEEILRGVLTSRPGETGD